MLKWWDFLCLKSDIQVEGALPYFKSYSFILAVCLYYLSQDIQISQHAHWAFVRTPLTLL